MENIFNSLALGFTFCWIAWMIFTSLNRNIATRTQAAVQEKFLARIDSAQALLDFVAHDAGRKFLETLGTEPPEPPSPSGRILFGIQAGIVLTCFGAAMLILHHHLDGYSQGFLIIGTASIGVGIGFILAAAASLRFSRKLGLLAATRAHDLNNDRNG